MSQVENALPRHQEGLIPGFYIPPIALPEPRHISEQSAFLGVCAANGLQAQEIASICGYTRRTADRRLAAAYEVLG